jgi:hypothetical protein
MRSFLEVFQSSPRETTSGMIRLDDPYNQSADCARLVYPWYLVKPVWFVGEASLVCESCV